MTDPFVTFDTLTVGSEIDLTPTTEQPETGLPAILARLPKVEPTPPPQPKKINRLDAAEPTIPVSHLVEAEPQADHSIDTQELPGYLSLKSDPTAAIRIDTVNFSASEEELRQPAPQPAMQEAPEPTILRMPESVVATETGPVAEDLNSWVLNLESALQPYARWIALAAVVAALGLTIVLLRGGQGAAGQNLDQQPVAPADASAVAIDEPSEGPYWPTVEVDPATNQATVVAAGPASAPRPAGQPVLTGEVQPVGAVPTHVADRSALDTQTRTQR